MHSHDEGIAPLAIEIEADTVVRGSDRLPPYLEDAERAIRTAATATFHSQGEDAIKYSHVAVIGLHPILPIGHALAAGARRAAVRVRRTPRDAGHHQSDLNIPESEAGLHGPNPSTRDVAKILASGALRPGTHAPRLPMPHQRRSEDEALDREARRCDGVDEALPRCPVHSMPGKTTVTAASAAASAAAPAPAAGPAGTRLVTAKESRRRRDAERGVIPAPLEVTRTAKVDEDADAAEEIVERTLLAGGVTVHPSLHSHPLVVKSLMFWKMNLVPLLRSRSCPSRKTTKRWVPRKRRRHESSLGQGSTLTDWEGAE